MGSFTGIFCLLLAIASYTDRYEQCTSLCAGCSLGYLNRVTCKRRPTPDDDGPPEPSPPGLRLISPEEAANQPKYTVGIRQRTRAGFSAPAVFDARTRWPQCSSIRTMRNQGPCGTCWAVSAASVLSDRMCITREQNDFISANQVAGCTNSTRSGMENCVNGGDPSSVYKMASLYGFSSGGEFGSKNGCVPYSVDPAGYSAVPLTCATTCTTAWPQNLTVDSTSRVVDSYWINYYVDMSIQANIDSNVNKMQEDLFFYGPITGAIRVYDDFQNWRPINGTYVPGLKANFVGNHSIRIIGWNQTDERDRHWLVANSWGTYFGDNGVWRVKMGSNVIGIESSTSAPIVDVSAKIPCNSASFCKLPIDQGVKLQYNVSGSSTYLFQGDCKLQVAWNATSRKLTAVGSAQPISKQFLNVPTPVQAQTVYKGTLNLLNAAGKGGNGCTQARGTAKYECTGGSWSLTASPFAIRSNGETFTYWKDTYPQWMLQGSQASRGYAGVWIDDLFTKNTNLTLITAFLNIDDTQMFVFGKGTTGNPLTGIIKYPDSSGGFAWKTLPTVPTRLQGC